MMSHHPTTQYANAELKAGADEQKKKAAEQQYAKHEMRLDGNVGGEETVHDLRQAESEKEEAFAREETAANDQASSIKTSSNVDLAETEPQKIGKQEQQDAMYELMKEMDYDTLSAHLKQKRKDKEEKKIRDAEERKKKMALVRERLGPDSEEYRTLKRIHKRQQELDKIVCTVMTEEELKEESLLQKKRLGLAPDTSLCSDEGIAAFKARCRKMCPHLFPVEE